MDFRHARALRAGASRARALSSDSTSPSRSISPSASEKSVLVTMRAISGRILCAFPLLRSDKRTSVGALHQHAKSALDLRETDFRLAIGTHLLDSLSAKLFLLKPVLDEIDSDPPDTLNVTLIRIPRTT